ncbi:MAG: tetratricopeptide repeat protein [Pirellulaceae bacterium]|jgi:tetratricopeptide (TPR) repeat protein|nr:tetratricopeptide repeat protein [Pirellulaceae bacterium]MDP6723160.1 tetratricopeptide repeat protein [Pirellulaceae bacterium]
MSAVQKHLATAREFGLPADRIQREHWLALAQDGQMREAGPHLSELLFNPDGDGEEIVHAFAIGYLKTQNHRMANQLLDVWAADFPNVAEPHFLRGVMDQDNDSWAPAIEHFERALEIDASHPRAALHLAHCLHSSKQHAEALVYFDLASRSPVAKLDAAIGKALCLCDLGRNDEGAQLLRDVLEGDPENTKAALELARLDVEEGKYDQALRRLRLLHQREPGDFDIRYALATALRGLGHNDEAHRHFDAVIFAREQLQKAVIMAEQPDPDVETRYQVGVIYLEYGVPKNGIFWLRSVLNQVPNHAPTHRALADYYEGKSAEDPSYRELASFHRNALSESSTPEKKSH